ncbi:hypothetical protein HDV00_009881 [Rhizophlyctis rosea]|nr:hypothetical protein HDV00_009881 [Rhizophlyctis rosea]
MDDYGTEEKVLAFYRYLRMRNFRFTSEDLINVLKAGSRAGDYKEVITTYRALKMERAALQSQPAWVHEAVTRAYLKRGWVDRALDILNVLEEGGGVASTGVYENFIAYYADKDGPRDAMRILDRLLGKGLQPSGAILGMLVVLLPKDGPDRGRLFEIIATSDPELQHDPYMFLNLIRQSAFRGQLSEAKKYLRYMREQTSDEYRLVDAYNDLLLEQSKAANADIGHGRDWLLLLEEMKASGLKANTRTFTVQLHHHWRMGDIPAFHKCWKEMRDAGIQPDEAAYVAHVRASAAHGNVNGMERAFKNMLKSNVVPNDRIVTSLIAGYSSHKRPKQAQAAFERAMELGIPPTVMMFNALMHSCAKLGDMTGLTGYWSRMVEGRLKPDAVSYTILMLGLAVSKDPDLPRIFRRVFTSEVQPTVHAYTLLYTYYLKEGDMEAANVVMEEMLARNIRPNVVTTSALMSTYAQLGDTQSVIDTFRMLTESGMKLQARVARPVMEAFRQANRPEEVIRVFDQLDDLMIYADRAVFHLALQAYIEVGQVDAASGVLKMMKERYVDPDWSTWGALLYLMKGDRMVPLGPFWDLLISMDVSPTRKALSRMVEEKARVGDVEGVFRVVCEGHKYSIKPPTDARIRIMELLLGKKKVDLAIQLMEQWVGVYVTTDMVDYYKRVVKLCAETGDAGMVVSLWNRMAGLKEGNEESVVERDGKDDSAETREQRLAAAEESWTEMFMMTVDALLSMRSLAQKEMHGILTNMTSNRYRRVLTFTAPNVYPQLVRKLLMGRMGHIAEDLATRHTLQALTVHEVAAKEDASQRVGLTVKGAALVVRMCVRHLELWGAKKGMAERVRAFWAERREDVAKLADDQIAVGKERKEG